MIITLTEYKSYADFKTTNSDDKIQFIVDYVNDFIEKFCGTKFTRQEVLSERQIVTEGTVVLKHAPVLEVVQVSSRGESITDFYLESEEGILTFENVKGPIEVNYFYGYDSAPAGLKIPAFELVTYFNKREFNKSQTIGSTGESVSFTDPKTIPPHIRAGLELYRVL